MLSETRSFGVITAIAASAGHLDATNFACGCVLRPAADAHMLSLFFILCVLDVKRERERCHFLWRLSIQAIKCAQNKERLSLFFFAAFYERAKRQIIILELSFLSARAYCNCALVFIRVPAAKFIYLGCNKIVLSIVAGPAEREREL